MNFLVHMLDFQLIHNEKFINHSLSKQRTSISRVLLKLDVLNGLMSQANAGLKSKKQGKGYLEKLGYAR